MRASIRRHGDRLIFFGLLLISLAAGMAYAGREHVWCTLVGPVELDTETLAGMANINDLPRRKVKFRAAQAISTNAFVGRGDTPNFEYVYFKHNNRAVLVKRTISSSEQEITGFSLTPNPFEKTVIDRVEIGDPATRIQFAPFVVDSCTRNGLVVLLASLFVGPLLVWGAVLFRRGLRYRLTPSVHPAMKRMLVEPDAEAAIEKAESDLESAEIIGGAQFGTTWLRYFCTREGYCLIKIEEIVWLYTSPWPASKNIAVVIADSFGTQIHIESKPADADHIVALLSDRNPGIIIGFDPRFQHEWNINPAGFQETIHSKYLQT